MTRRRPIFTILSLLVAAIFALVSRPLLVYSIHQQLAGTEFRSDSAEEDSGRMAGFAVIVGQFIAGGMGAVVGVVFAVVGFLRKERWMALRWCSFTLNLAAAGVTAYAVCRDIPTGAISFAAVPTDEPGPYEGCPIEGAVPAIVLEPTPIQNLRGWNPTSIRDWIL